nr:hypothetical protein [Tanacetum cinerariifolium]
DTSSVGNTSQTCIAYCLISDAIPTFENDNRSLNLMQEDPYDEEALDKATEEEGDLVGLGQEEGGSKAHAHYTGSTPSEQVLSSLSQLRLDAVTKSLMPSLAGSRRRRVMPATPSPRAVSNTSSRIWCRNYGGSRHQYSHHGTILSIVLRKPGTGRG